MTQRILTCDDESYITRAVSMKLQKAGFEVETCGDGQAAWEVIERELPCLLITDYQMPRLDGIELCRRVRSHAATENLPIIMLTAKGYEMNAGDLVREHRLAGVVHKQFSPRELLQLVHDTVGAARPAAP